MTPEFSRRVPLDTIGGEGRTVTVEADAAERAALAARFALVALDALTATVVLVARADGIEARGRLHASVVQACVITGDPVPARIDQSFALRFVDPALAVVPEEDFELDEAACDVVAHDGGAIDLGEAVAQTLGLALDPFPRASNVPGEEQVWRAGPDAGPFAALKGLLPD